MHTKFLDWLSDDKEDNFWQAIQWERTRVEYLNHLQTKMVRAKRYQVILSIVYFIIILALMCSGSDTVGTYIVIFMAIEIAYMVDYAMVSSKINTIRLYELYKDLSEQTRNLEKNMSGH